MAGKHEDIPCDDQTAAGLVADLLAIEHEIAEQQDAKGTIYKAARETYGKRFANGLKLAVKKQRMDQDQVSEADEVDAEAERILAAYRKPRAPRATRSANPVPDHDAETGEITEPQSETAVQMQAGFSRSADTSLAGAEGIADQQPITEQQSAPAARDLTSDLIPQGDSGQVATHTPEMANEAAGIRPNPSMSEQTAPAPVQRSDAGNSATLGGVTSPGEQRTTNILNREQGILKLRPNCQQPAACKSSGGKAHCWSCTKQTGATA